MNIEDIVKNIEDYVIEQRRYFHENPELSWEEFNTSKRVQEELEKMGIPFETGCETAVIGTIRGAHEGPVLGIRADMDALPVVEETGLSFASKNPGVMHACGHDAHTATLLGAAKVLNEMKDKIKGSVKLVFQPAEEDIANSGAKCVLTMDGFKDIDRMIALHYMTTIPSGEALLKSGPLMASSDTFDIYINGKGGHGAIPSSAIDPIVAGSLAVTALQTFVSRENNPSDTSVLTIAAFNSGDTPNVIPERAQLKGSTRNVSNDVRNGMEEKMRRILDGVALSTRTEIKLDYHHGSPATINDKEASDLGEKILEEIFGDGFSNDFPTVMGSEDFSRYLEIIPGCMTMIGATIEGKEYPHHNEKFDINEDVLINGVEYFVRYALEYILFHIIT